MVVLSSVLCSAVPCVFSSFAITTLGKRGLVAWLLLSSGCNVNVILQLLTSISVDMRIYLPEKVIFTKDVRPR